MNRGSAGQFGNRYDRDDNRYDNFYRGGGGAAPSGGGGARGGRSGGAGGRDWEGSRDRSFFNRNDNAGGGRRDDRGGHAAGMMAALQAQQTQNMLAALSHANNFRQSGAVHSGLLPTPGGRYQDRDRRGGRGGGDRRGGAPRPGDKRRGEPPAGGYGKQRDRRPPPAKAAPKSSDKPKPKPKEAKKEKAEEEEVVPVITEADIPDEDVEISDELMDKVETLRQREKAERNVADEDIGKLVVFCYTGKGYHCSSCNISLTKEAGFQHHIQGKSHVMNVIDARGGDGAKYAEVRAVLDIDLVSDDWFENSEKAKSILLKQAKQQMIAQKEIELKAMLNFNKEPSNFFKCDFNARKTAKKDGDTMTFTHLVETTMAVKEFTGDKFFGCEFVKAESGFNCRLCDMYIKDHKNVIVHIASKNHKNMYANFLKKNPNYETKQKQQNIDLSDALSIEESKYVVLHETKGTDMEKVFIDHCESLCTRIPDLLVAKEEENKKKAAEEEAKKAAEEKEAKEKAEAEAKEKETATEAASEVVVEAKEEGTADEAAAETADEPEAIAVPEAEEDAEAAEDEPMEEAVEEDAAAEEDADEETAEVEEEEPVEEEEAVEEEEEAVEEEEEAEEPEPEVVAKPAAKGKKAAAAKKKAAAAKSADTKKALESSWVEDY